MKINPLKNRWETKNIHDYCHGGSMLASPFGKTEQGYDYRGISCLSTRNISDLIVSDCDLRWSDFTQCWVENNKFTNVVFSYADLKAARDQKNIFERCLFEEVKFDGSALGGKRSQYRNCKFIKCTFKKATFSCAAFEGCHFENCNLSGVDFFGSSFADCKFIGILSRVWFHGSMEGEGLLKSCGPNFKNSMTNVDFSESIFQDVNFSDECPLIFVKKPNNEMVQYFSDWKNLLLHLRSRLELVEDSDREEARICVEAFLVDADRQNEYIVNFDDLETGSKAPAKFGMRMRKLFLETYASMKI